MLTGLFWFKLVFEIYIYSTSGPLSVNYPFLPGPLLIGDFQTEIGCPADWSSYCDLTGFKKVESQYRLVLDLPSGSWKYRVFDGHTTYGAQGLKDGLPSILSLSKASSCLFIFDPVSHLVQVRVLPAYLESRALDPELNLTDSLVFDPNNNMIANPGDSILYTMILKNETGQSVLNAILSRYNDPNLIYDPASLKASPLAFRDTFQYSTNPLVVSVPGVLSNDFDLNDVLPNPPYYNNLWVYRVESNQANVGNTVTTAAGGMITLNADGSLTYDSTGIQGASADSISYVIRDLDGFEDSASIHILFNLAPILSVGPPDTICAFEQMDTFLATMVGITDDGLNVQGATMTICENYLPGEDTLLPGTLPMGIGSTWNELNGSLTLSGSASLSDYETALEGVQYFNSAQAPSALVRRVCIAVNDGSLNSNTIEKRLKVIPVNDCPLPLRDTFLAAENGLLPMSNALSNDTDPDGDGLSAVPDNQSMQGGMISIDMNGIVNYTQSNFTDSLALGQVYFLRMQYTATDGDCMVSDSLVIRLTGVNDPPLAYPDSFMADQLTKLTVGAPGILADDKDIDQGAALGVGRVNGQAGLVNMATLLPSGALLMVNGDGSFMYTPGCAGGILDSFQYQAVDEHGAFSDTVTVVVQVDQRLWFVQEGAVPGTAGGFSAPFDQLADAEAASAPGDYIFVFPGTYHENLSLKNDQKLIGAAVDWNCPPSGALLRAASGISRVNGTVTLAMNDTIRGVTMGDLPMATAFSFINTSTSSVGNLYICNTKINQNAPGGGISIGSGGNLNICLDSFKVNGGTNALILDTCTGQIGLVNGNISAMTMASLWINAGFVDLDFNGSLNHNAISSVPAVNVTGGHSGQIVFLAGSLTASSGNGLQFSNADGVYDFKNGFTGSLNGGDAGIDILDGSNGRFLFGSSFNINDPQFQLVRVDNSSATLVYSGSFTKDNNSNTGIEITNNTGDTIQFDGTGTKIISTSTANAIHLSSNSGTLISFSGGNLDIDCTSGTGMNVTSSGTLTVTGANNTINCSSGGHALKMLNTNIGSGNLNFDYIASTGGMSTGILLYNSGTAGGLLVSRGSITNKTGSNADSTQGTGIFLSKCKGIVLDSVTLNDFDNFGILGYEVENFTMTYVTVSSSTKIGNAAGEGAVSFGIQSIRNGLTGTVTVNNSLIEDGYINNFSIYNNTGTLSQMNMNGTTIRDNSSTAPGNSGFYLYADGNANINLDISGSSFLRHFEEGVVIVNQGSGTVDVEVKSNCIFTDNFNHLVLVLNHSTGDLNFDILSSQFSNPGLSNAGSPIGCQLGSSSASGSILSGIINANTISNNNSTIAPGIAIYGNGNGKIIANILNNMLSGIAYIGIDVWARDGSNTLDATIQGNNINNTSASALQGIYVQSGNPSITDMTGVCAKIGGSNFSEKNTITLGSSANTIYVRNRTSTSTFNLQGVMGSYTPAQVITLLETYNTVSSMTVNASAVPGSFGSCTPAFPLFNQTSIK